MSEQPIEVVTEDASLENEIEALEAAIKPEDTADSENEGQKDIEGDESKPKKVGGVAKRISELTANWREEQRTRQKLEQMLESKISKEAKPTAQPTATESKEPSLDQFKTYEEYVAAVADHRAEQKVQQLLKQQEEQRQRQDAERQKAEQRSTFQAKAEEFATTTPDFDEVAFNPSLPVSDVMADALNLSDKGPEILYHLGKHPDEAARISRLPPVQAALEIGRLEAKLSLPQPRTVTKAPPPIAPSSGGQGSMNVDPDKMTADEWRKWRDDQTRKR